MLLGRVSWVESPRNGVPPLVDANPMWLINTSTLELEFFANPEKASYAILSHTWGDEEVVFQEFQNLDKANSKYRFAKIVRTCEIARQQGLRYAWVDTCCI